MMEKQNLIYRIHIITNLKHIAQIIFHQPILLPLKLYTQILLSLNFDYTFADSYDAASCDPEEKAAYADNECREIGSKVQSAKVRVPRHSLQSKINYNISANLKGSLKGKYVGEARDFGNANNNWTDVILTDYFVFDLETSYQLFNDYKMFVNIGNILDEEYEQAYQYSTMGRTFNIGIRRVH